MTFNVHGEENIPTDENVIFISNHQSHLDIIVLMVLIKKQITFFAKQELKSVPILSQDISNMGHVFVDRKSIKRSSEQLAIIEEQLNNKRNVIVFPEGTRSDDGTLLPFKRGAFLMSANTKTTILPCYLHGTGTVLNKKSFLFKPGKIQLIFKKPIIPIVKDNNEKQLSKDLQLRGYEAVKGLQEELISSL